MDSEFFANFDFYREPVGVPARFAFAIVTSHRPIARKEIFYGPRQAVSRVRFSIGSWGSLVEYVFRAPLPPAQSLIVDLSVPPVIQDTFFLFGKFYVCFNWLKHEGSF